MIPGNGDDIGARCHQPSNILLEWQERFKPGIRTFDHVSRKQHGIDFPLNRQIDRRCQCGGGGQFLRVETPIIQVTWQT